MIRLLTGCVVGMVFLLLLPSFPTGNVLKKENVVFEMNNTLPSNAAPFVIEATSTISVSTTTSPSESTGSQKEDAEEPILPKIPEKIVQENPSNPSNTGEVVSKLSETLRPTSLSPDILNNKARLSLVNILCEANSPLRSTSGSGMVIDERGIILTNAHIAQYFLLADGRFPVSCTIRTGSPAVQTWRAKLIFIPKTWVEAHAEDILKTRATGTGEHDFAFLIITEGIDGASIPGTFPHVSLNSSDPSPVPGSQVLVVGYPAEFIGGAAARSSLYASSVFSHIKQLLTFTTETIDVVSIGGTALAQSGSSGGGFIDMNGSLAGLVVTTTVGETTGARDLHAITPTHMDLSIKKHTGLSLREFLSKDTSSLSSFSRDSNAKLSQVFEDVIAQSQH